MARKIPRRHRRFARQHFRQRLGIAHEAAAPLVDIEAVLQPARRGCAVIATARHVEVRQAVAIGIEEQRAPVVVVLVGRPGLPLGGFHEAAVLLLQEELARHTGRAANEDVIQPVAVDVRHGDGRALARQHVGQQGLDVVIDQIAGLVPILDRMARIDRLKQLISGRKRRSGEALARGISLFHGHQAIDVQTGE